MPGDRHNAISSLLARHETTDIVIARKMKRCADIDVTIQKPSGTPALRYEAQVDEATVERDFCAAVAERESRCHVFPPVYRAFRIEYDGYEAARTTYHDSIAPKSGYKL